MRESKYNPNTLVDRIIIAYRTRKVMRLFKEKGVVYDFGCGNNVLVNKLNDSGYDAYGIDVEGGNKVICADLNGRLPIEANVADYVVSLANIEHLDKPQFNMQEAYRILKPGGKLFLTTPSPRAKPILELMVFTKIIVKEETEDHKQYFTKKTLREILKYAGFSDIKINYFQFTLNILAIAMK